MKISRRAFLGSGAAAVVAGTMARSTVFGSNERIKVAIIGLNGQGHWHMKDLIQMDEVEIVALCDPDSNVLGLRADEAERRTKKRPKTYTDVRDLLAQDDIDAVTIATPNHWHTLAAVWACQAGKDVYVEKPLSHDIWEGRQLTQAAKQYGRIVQHGTQSRSNPTWMRDIRLIHEGFIGDIVNARGICFKTHRRYELPHADPSDPPEYLDWNIWQGPAQERPFTTNYVHYNWHWFWDYGCGETGNHGVHQMDVAVWGLNKGLPVKVFSAGGRYAWKDQAETPNTQATTFTYADGTMMTFEVRNLGSYDEGEMMIGNSFFGTEGYYLEGKGFFDYMNQPIEVKEPLPESAGRFGNFVKALQSRREEDIPATALQGHLSCTHCHLGNIAYRLGRALEFDPETERFVDDEEANALVRRDYREGFEVPELA